MRAVVITKHGGPEALQVQERPDPQLRSGEVRIEVAACGINFADVMARIGVYPDAPKPPCVVGYEVAGTVVELGEGVRGARARSACPGQHGVRWVCLGRLGLRARLCRLARAAFLRAGRRDPRQLRDRLGRLVGYGSLQPGERVLVHSAGGGVGIAAVQLARRFGASEIYGTASPAKHERVRELGYDHVLDYKDVNAKGGLPQFDVILDAIGGHSLRTSYNLLRPGGRLVGFGASAVVSGAKRNLPTALRTLARMPRFSLVKQMSESKAVIGLNMLTLLKDRGTIEPWLEPLRELLDDGTIEPVIAGTFSFEEAGAAQDMLTQRRNIGKVVSVP